MSQHKEVPIVIGGVSKVVIEVEDQERAKAFWTQTLGFEVLQDAPYGEERWLEVCTPDKAVAVVLDVRKGPPPTPKDAGLPTSNVSFYADDLEQTHTELTARGVEFPQPPVRQPFGWWSIFQDPDGTASRWCPAASRPGRVLDEARERSVHVITVTRRTTATPEAIWRLWADVPNRTRWDDALERITLEGPFQCGADGVVKLRGQPERRFKVVDTVPPKAYTDRFFLPLGGKMDWAHIISEVDGERAVTFDVRVSGPTSPILAPVLKRILRRELSSTLDKLIALAERT